MLYIDKNEAGDVYVFHMEIYYFRQLIHFILITNFGK